MHALTIEELDEIADALEENAEPGSREAMLAHRVREVWRDMLHEECGE